MLLRPCRRVAPWCGPLLVLLVAASLTGCRDKPGTGSASASGSESESASGSESESASASAPAPAPARRESVTILGGGDISFGRLIGQMLLRDPARDFFSSLKPWIRTADITFANLEGPLSDQGGETGSPANNLVFTGPPAGALALERAGFTIVSTANNHAWDYGKKALFETMDLLSRAGVRYAGTGRDRQEAYRPTIIDRDGLHIAFVAVTDIWNQGSLEKHPGADYVAGADPTQLTGVIKQLRESGRAEYIVVSYHGGAEYTDEPLTRTKEILRGAVDAGADLVLGHHPHVTQGIAFYRGKPIFYSLGNLLMRMHRDHPWTEYGFLARVTLRGAGSAEVAACPYRIFGTEIVPLAGHAQHERRFFEHLRAISTRVGGVSIAAPGEDGCAALSPPEPRSP